MLTNQRVLWRAKLVRAVHEALDRALDERLQAVSRAQAEAEERAAARQCELLDALRAWERRSRRDVMTALEQDAARTSGELLRRDMAGAVWYSKPHDTLRHGLREAPAGGLVLEFGVASGTTLAILAEQTDRQVFGFDSFDGLPEHWRLGFDAGQFAGAAPEVEGAELVVGLFADVLPGFLAAHPGPVAFVHVDCDLYSSTRTVLDAVGPRLVPGSVVVFDEYYNYPGWQEHEYRAWQEFTLAHGVAYEHLALTLDDEQVAMRVTAVQPQTG